MGGVRRPNRTATRRTIAALSSTGRLELVDAAVVGLARTTADLLDAAVVDPEQPAYARAAVGRLHLAAVLALTGKEAAGDDAGFGQVIAALSAPIGGAPMGDTAHT